MASNNPIKGWIAALIGVTSAIPGEVSHPKEIQAIDQVVQVCRKSKTIAGIHMFDVAQIPQWIAKGMRLIFYSSDINMLADAAMKDVAQIKKSIDD